MNYTYSMEFGYIEDVFDKNDSIIKKPEAIDQKKLVKFVVESNEKVKKREVIVYSTMSDDLDVRLDSEEYKYMQYSIDTVFDTDKNGNAIPKAVRTDYNYNETAFLRLLQEWYYNTKDKKIEVVVNAYCPVFPSYDEDKKLRGYRPMYWYTQYPITAKANHKINDTSIVWAHRVKFQVPVNPTEKEEFRNNRSAPGIKKLFDMELSSILFAQAQNNELTIYHPQTGKKLSAVEFKELITLRDTLYDVEANGDYSAKPITREIEIEDLDMMIIHQTFTFDPKNFTVTSKITSIILTYRDYNNNRSVELFEVKF